MIRHCEITLVDDIHPDQDAATHDIGFKNLDVRNGNLVGESNANQIDMALLFTTTMHNFSNCDRLEAQTSYRFV